ncbi:MAG: CPBP family intramembrane metalloprotease [Chloroflexi bacterium]|nr:MAG: CPBP family intramembrane metalloprotease [Chloroflexota bacterium]
MSEIQPARKRSVLASIFLSPEEPRLRAGWRLLIQTILVFLFVIITGIVATLLKIPQEALNSSFGNAVIVFIAFTGSVYIARRWLDKRSFESLGVELGSHTLRDILAGIGITFVQMGFIFVAMLSFGWLTLEGFAWEVDPTSVIITNLLVFFAAYILVGWSEELLSRGYHLQTIASGINLFWGVVISSAVFGLLHLGNPNVSGANAVAISAGIFFAGVYLAYAYIRTKQLWLAIGLHIGWNFFQGIVFGFPVSGTDAYALTRIKVHGPELWTGGAFGPESGLIVLPSLILGGFLIYLYTRRRGK